MTNREMFMLLKEELLWYMTENEDRATEETTVCDVFNVSKDRYEELIEQIRRVIISGFMEILLGGNANKGSTTKDLAYLIKQANNLNEVCILVYHYTRIMEVMQRDLHIISEKLKKGDIAEFLFQILGKK